LSLEAAETPLEACQRRLAATEAQLTAYARDLRVLFHAERSHR
jgi:hypothetical protein